MPNDECEGQKVLAMTSLQKKDGNWIFIVPIDGLVLTKVINNEITINRVTFVSKEKLPLIRKRLGIPIPLSELLKNIARKEKSIEKITRDFLESSKTFAILPYKGKPEEKEKDCIRVIRDELNILALSQMGWLSRHFNRRLEIMTSDKTPFYRKINIKKEIPDFTYGIKKTYNPLPLVTDKDWLTFHKRFFFLELLKVIKGNSNVAKNWRTILHRVAVMVGQSQNSDDLPFCFVWNVIALEMLLTNNNDKISEMLVKRAEYFLGWNEEWKDGNYMQRINDIYKKRCDFVHTGNSKFIDINDLVFTDNLLFNILNNIIRNRNKIKDKTDIIEFAKKYEAEKLLKQKSKYQLGKFEFMRKHYTDNEFKNM